MANIFDSYEVYAGHEVGLVTDFLSLEEATEFVQQMYSSSSELGSIPESSADYRMNIIPRDLGHLKTLELVPDAKPFKIWLEENRDNAEFREMLGIR